MGELEIDDLIFPTIGGGVFLPCCELCWVSLLPRQIGGASLANLILGWSLIIFPIQPFLRVRGHNHTSFVPFAYVPLQDISWSKSHIVWISKYAWWLMS